jgi:hypothetical protein
MAIWLKTPKTLDASLNVPELESNYGGNHERANPDKYASNRN